METGPSRWDVQYPAIPEPPSAYGEIGAKVGCLSCRARRIKCDEGRPTCDQCGKGGFECLWTDDHGNSGVPARKRARTRERSRQACLPCRSRKIRCAGPVGDGDDAPCPRCERLSLACSWNPHAGIKGEEQHAKHEHLEPEREHTFANVEADVITKDEGTDGSALDTLMRDKPELQRIIRIYFGTVHYYGFLTFIHEPSFMRLLDLGKAPRPLTAVMAACSLRFAGDASSMTLSRADALFDETFPSIREQLYEGYGAIELMTVILAHRYEHTRGNFSSSWMLWGNAVRMMHFLALHVFDETYPKPHTLKLNPLLKPEALRRLAWATFYLDTMADAGRHGVHAVSLSGYHVQLPCDENAFVRGLDVSTGPLDPARSPAVSPAVSFGGSAHAEGPSHLGISAHLIRTAAMRRRVLHFNSRLKYSEHPPSKMLDDLQSFEAQVRECIAELPAELAYSEENLFIHNERRTAFILLHAIRHNCFLMLAMARLNVCARDARLGEMTQGIRRDRIRHALPVARIVADALRLGISCDPLVSIQAYTVLEVLLFDPRILAQTDPSVNPKDTRYTTALRTLMELIRLKSRSDETMRHLRVEACRRLIRCGMEDILIPADWDATRSDSIATGDDDTEFDFKFFRWHRFENPRVKRTRRTPWAAEALLDLGTGFGSGGVSRANSPPEERVDDMVDAGEVSLRADPAGSVIPAKGSDTPRTFPSTVGTSYGGNGNDTLADRTPSMTTTLPSAGESFITPELPRQYPSPTSLLEQRRWADLDYQWDRQDQYAFPGSTGASADGYASTGPAAVGDDFSRFLEQAGYAVTDEMDPFSWASGVD